MLVEQINRNKLAYMKQALIQITGKLVEMQAEEELLQIPIEERIDLKNRSLDRVLVSCVGNLIPLARCLRNAGILSLYGPVVEDYVNGRIPPEIEARLLNIKVPLLKPIDEDYFTAIYRVNFVGGVHFASNALAFMVFTLEVDSQHCVYDMSVGSSKLSYKVYCKKDLTVALSLSSEVESWEMLKNTINA